MDKVHQEGGQLLFYQPGVNPLYGEKLKVSRCGLYWIIPGIRVALSGVMEANESTARSSELALLFRLPMLFLLPPAQARIGLAKDRLKPLRVIQ
jgi:hypothetical protein